MAVICDAGNACAGPRRFSLSAPSAREKATLSVGVNALPDIRRQLAEEGRVPPDYVYREFEDYLKCGRLEHWFIRGAASPAPLNSWLPSDVIEAVLSQLRRAAWPKAQPYWSLKLLSEQLMRQGVLSFPYPLRFLFATRSRIMGQVVCIVYRAIATPLIKQAGRTHQADKTGAVTLIQCFGSTLNLKIHFTCCSPTEVKVFVSKHLKCITSALANMETID